MPDEGEYKKWLKAQIALQQEALAAIDEQEASMAKQGQIALKRLRLERSEKE